MTTTQHPTTVAARQARNARTSADRLADMLNALAESHRADRYEAECAEAEFDQRTRPTAYGD